MQHTNRQVNDGTITAEYARLEGIELVPEFDRDRYKVPFVLEKMHPTFPVKGCTICREMMLSSRPVDLKEWFHLSQEWGLCDYYDNQLFQQESLYNFDRERKLLCAVVDLDPRYVEAAYRKLVGKPSGGIYSHASLLFIGAALWNIGWVPFRRVSGTWKEFVERKNLIYERTRKAADERQAAVDAFLAEIKA